MDQVVAYQHSSILEDLNEEQQRALARARRTAFVARFIVLRESKRSRAHRLIEQMEWDDQTTAEDLYQLFRATFLQNGDNMEPVDRDLRRALSHASRSINHFIAEYQTRSTLSFIDALYDYERSNKLLFGDDEQPKHGGWLMPQDLARERSKRLADAAVSEEIEQ